ncbi:protein ENHANCED PSEUDOMONAS SUSCEPTIBILITY 1-like [Coffea arabica]|uniref:Protein ENHANCED PSEUDOMONAS SUSCEPTIBILITY 1-like n=1 Tax=Coffea arabica TaxID=13443 RepID=A0ABM4X0I2_COFAR
METPAVQYLSECFIRPKYTPEESKQPVYLAPWDVVAVFMHYMQKGFGFAWIAIFRRKISSFSVNTFPHYLFSSHTSNRYSNFSMKNDGKCNPNGTFVFAKSLAFDTDENQIQEFVQKLKESLSITLIHFYPLAGRLATQKKEENPSDLAFYIDCSEGPGARFIHASLDLTIDDITSPTHTPRIVGSLFDHGRSVNYAGHTKSLLTIQITELIDGIFIGCSMNHMVGDGTSLWHFLDSWSEIFKAEGRTSAISRPPVHDRWFPRGQHDPFLTLPFIHHDDHQVIISRDKANTWLDDITAVSKTPAHDGQHDPLLSHPLRDRNDQVIISIDDADTSPDDTIRERIFHFSPESVAKIKAKANAERNTTEISSLQALSAHLWRCIARARNFPSDRQTAFFTIMNVRSRLVPPMSQDCFGNYLEPAMATTGCGELLEQGLGWAAWLLHQAVINHSHEWINSWLQTPILPRRADEPDSNTVLLGGSPRFNMYGTEFGLGKPVAIRNGSGNKFDGKLIVSPGAEGGGSMDFEICLAPHAMASLECDRELMETVS